MEINQEKLEFQLESINTFVENNYRCTMELPPGLGKSYIGILTMQRLFKSFPHAAVCIIVPSDALRKQWLIDYDLKNAPNVDVETIQSAYGSPPKKKYRLTIFDEVHMFVSGPEFSKVFRTRRARCMMGLSGSLNSTKRQQLAKFGIPVKVEMTQEEALQRGFLTPTYVYHVPLKLNILDTKKLLDMRKEISTNINKLPQGVHFTKLLYDNDLVREYANRVGWTTGQVVGIANKLQRLIRKRQNFIDNHPLKYKAYKKCLEMFEGKQMITFSASTEMADQLTDITPEKAVSYHINIQGEIYKDNTLVGYSKKEKIKGKGRQKKDKVFYYIGNQRYERKDLTGKGFKIISSKKIRDRNYSLFLEGEKDIINSISALQQGINVSNLAVALEFSRSADELYYKQRVGRLRKDGGIYIRFYIAIDSKETKDAEKTRLSQVGSFVQVEFLEQINL